MSPHQTIMAVFKAHGVPSELIDQLEAMVLQSLTPISRVWWLAVIDDASSFKNVKLVQDISGPGKDQRDQREMVMRGLLRRLHRDDQAEADAAWDRLQILMRSLN